MSPGRLLSFAARYTFTRQGSYLSNFLSLLSMAGIILAIYKLFVDSVICVGL